jgi:hypothetical protein
LRFAFREGNLSPMKPILLVAAVALFTVPGITLAKSESTTRIKQADTTKVDRLEKKKPEKSNDTPQIPATLA